MLTDRFTSVSLISFMLFPTLCLFLAITTKEIIQLSRLTLNCGYHLPSFWFCWFDVIFELSNYWFGPSSNGWTIDIILCFCFWNNNKEIIYPLQMEPTEPQRSARSVDNDRLIVWVRKEQNFFTVVVGSVV